MAKAPIKANIWLLRYDYPVHFEYYLCNKKLIVS